MSAMKAHGKMPDFQCDDSDGASRERRTCMGCGIVWLKEMDKCSLCGKVRYCSKVCEVMHRKEFHKYHLFQQPEFIAEGTERQNGLVRQGLHIFQQPEFIEAYREGNRDRQNNLT